MSHKSHADDGISRLEVAGATTYTYDWVGKLLISDFRLRISNCRLNGRRITLTAANLLESITHNSVQGEPVSSMEWDADSNRVSFTSSTGGTWEYVYDITAGIPAVIKETGLKTYVREPDGSLIAMFVESYPYYYHFDALGSTRMLTDESGHITDSYTYDAWGNLLTHDPNSISQPYQYVGQLGYYTHWQDSNLPLLHLGVRFYDPGTGRFGQRDGLRAGKWNFYSYAEDRPQTLIDPSGEDAKDWVCNACRYIPKISLCLGGAYFTGWICRAGYMAFRNMQRAEPGIIAGRLAEECVCKDDGAWTTTVVGNQTYGYRCGSTGPIYRRDGNQWTPTPIRPIPDK